MQLESTGKPLRDSFWFLNTLVTFKAKAAETGGCYALAEQVAPLGFATPFHSHAGEDEAWYVIEGEITLFKNTETIALQAGSFAFVEGHTPHGFRVSGSGPAKILLILTPGLQFQPFVEEAGEPATEHRLPEPLPLNFPRIKEISERYGSTFLGPLPSSCSTMEVVDWK